MLRDPPLARVLHPTLFENIMAVQMLIFMPTRSLHSGQSGTRYKGRLQHCGCKYEGHLGLDMKTQTALIFPSGVVW